MITVLHRWHDRLLGRGDAACTVPVFDGPLQPNQALEPAQVLFEATDPHDLASDGHTLWLADGPRVLRLGDGGDAAEVARAEAPITAVAPFAGGIAWAVGGREVRVQGGRFDGRRWADAAGLPFVAVNALAGDGDTLIATEGSAAHAPTDWQRDLMTLGCSGRVLRMDATDGHARVLAKHLHHAFGVVTHGSSVWVSESWRHRVIAPGAGERPRPVIEHLPGYPSRLAPAAGGGWWLTVFAPRTQLVEFVLRERAFRERMIATIPPELWVAPQLRSGHSFLEPLQGGGIKQMGVLKPWAPPRSYGLVIRLDAAGRPLFSLHSRVGGRHHGIVAAVEHHDGLVLLSAGARRVLRLPLKDLR